jgi:hypothetical protein
MLNAFGWCVVMSSRSPYVGATLNDAVAQIDNQVAKQDDRVATDLLAWLGDPVDQGDFMWSLKPIQWSDAKVLLYTASRNHRGSRLWDFHDWIVQNAPGSYGITYVHDDEDDGAYRPDRRHGIDRTGVFRVFRIANGKIDEFDDPFLSPIMPTIRPNDLC